MCFFCLDLYVCEREGPFSLKTGSKTIFLNNWIYNAPEIWFEHKDTKIFKNSKVHSVTLVCLNFFLIGFCDMKGFSVLLLKKKTSWQNYMILFLCYCMCVWSFLIACKLHSSAESECLLCYWWEMYSALHAWPVSCLDARPVMWVLRSSLSATCWGPAPSPWAPSSCRLSRTSHLGLGSPPLLLRKASSHFSVLHPFLAVMPPKTPTVLSRHLLLPSLPGSSLSTRSFCTSVTLNTVVSTCTFIVFYWTESLLNTEKFWGIAPCS